MEKIEMIQKLTVGAIAGMVANFFLPVLPYVALCPVLVVWDTVSAVRLALKLGDKVRSRGLWKMVCTLGRVYLLLCVAHAAQVLIVSAFVGLDVLKFTAGAICAVQGLSILENESSRTGAPWARYLRRWLADKAKRHLDGMLNGEC